MGVKIEHRIGVQATSDVIWDIIADVERWGDWNPLYPKASGKIRMGDTLTLTLALPGRPQQVIQPRVVDWTPRELLHWRLSAMGGFLRSIRFIEIDELAPGSCILSNGEIFGGLAAGALDRKTRHAIRQGFTEMGEALKARAEAAWQAQAPAPKSVAT